MDSEQSPPPAVAENSQLTVRSAYSQAVANFNSGHYPAAEQLCNAILQAVPDHVDAINVLGVIAQRVNRHDLAVEQFNAAIKINPDRADFYHNLGNSFCHLAKYPESVATLKQGLAIEPENAAIIFAIGTAFNQARRFSEAIEYYQRALSIRPDYVEAYCNLGNVLQEQERLEEAVVCYQKALAIKPDQVEAIADLGVVYKKQGMFAAAKESLRKAISLRPDFANAYYNLGAILAAQGEFAEARTYLQQAVVLKPGFSKAFVALGATLEKQAMLDQAIEHYQQAIALQPGLLEAYINLGRVQIEKGLLNAAIDSLQKAVALNSGSHEALTNLGYALYHKGELEAAVASFQKAIAVKPDHVIAINNLGFVLEAMSQDPLSAQGTESDIAQIIGKIPAAVESDPDKLQADSAAVSESQQNRFVKNFLELSIIKHRVKKLAGLETRQEHAEIMLSFDLLKPAVIANPQTATASGVSRAKNRQKLNMVALYKFGRSGSGLLHSLLDSHPEIAIMPGVYMSGFFARDVWQKITSSGFAGAAENFARLYEVLFDARCKQQHPPHHIGDGYGAGSGVGVNEGFDRMGESHDTPLTLDRNRFLLHLEQILAGCAAIDQGSFFAHVHNAYTTTLGSDFSDKKMILHHLHEHDQYSVSNLIKHYPDTAFLTIIRNPVQSCESWARKAAINKKLPNGYTRYSSALGRIFITLRDVNCPEFIAQDAVGIRLEDIKKAPHGTMERLCGWLGIADSPTLHESTIQGLKWWGDPGSVLFGKTQTQDHGQVEPIRVKTGVLFSEKDQLILATLFYPLSLQFGYVEADQIKFLHDLRTIRPLLLQPLDFERQLATDFPADYPQLEQTAAYKSFHAMLLGKWRVLDAEGTYPGMFKPLPE